MEVTGVDGRSTELFPFSAMRVLGGLQVICYGSVSVCVCVYVCLHVCLSVCVCGLLFFLVFIFKSIFV